MKKRLNHILHVFLCTITGIISITAQPLPIGYAIEYSNACNSASGLKSFTREYAQFWNISMVDKTAALIISPSTYTGDSVVPTSRGIISGKVFGDYIIEFQYKFPSNSGDETNCLHLIGPAKSNKTYYSYSISVDTVKFYFVNAGKIVLLDKRPIPGYKPGWNKIRAQRDILTRNTSITFNATKQKIIFNDKNLVMGLVGFGVQFGKVYIKNIEIWAPTSISDNVFIW